MNILNLFRETVNTFGAIDIVSNNAWVVLLEEWEKMIQISQVLFYISTPLWVKILILNTRREKSNRIQSQCMLICKIGHTLCNLVSSLCNISDFKDKINFINLNIIYVFQKISVMHCTYLAGEYKKKSSKSKSEIIVNFASYAGLVQKSHIDVFNVETSYVLYYLLNNFLFMIVSWR